MSELGKRLKDARESKGYSLDDLQRITKIQKRYLTGIEEGSYDSMPGKFYVRAFIKQYCEAVGLPPEEIFEEYKSEIPVTQHEEIPDSLSRVQTRKTVSESSSKILDFIPTLLIVVVIIGIFFIAWVFLSGKMGNNDAADNDTNKNSQVAVDEKDVPKEGDDSKKSSDKEEKPAADEDKKQDKEAHSNDTKKEDAQTLEQTSVQGYKTTYELNGTDQFNLSLSAEGDSWIRVYNQEEKILFEGTLKKGDQEDLDLSEESQAYLVIGDAANAIISVNGEEVEYGIPTDVVRQDVIINYSKESSE
ncbi:helix-turn-helix domain-containing protein [Rossellomorea marisflavi]|uniref:helix-turn-helix domain-containing protein n=1 Tax=Rossellomorea marisflavi TaxID=189381 RepID=UPI003457D6F6